MKSTEPVVVIGAGVAGLAASASLRQAGIACRTLEASSRVGGRAWTTNPTALGGAAFDMGASWLHAAERNPLAAAAAQAGEELIDSEQVRTRLTIRGGVVASSLELDEYDAAERAFHALIAERLQGPDMSLADAVAPDGGRPWMASVVNWEAPIIAAADAAVLSLRDWHTNLLHGANVEVRGGLGAFVLRHFAAIPVDLETEVTAVTWDGAGARVTTSRGVINASACIVTVSTGILASGQISFTPELPEALQDAIAGLPMGLLNKVALRAAGSDRSGLPNSCGIDQFVAAIGDPAMTFIAWPHGQDHVIGFIGGGAAADLERAKLERAGLDKATLQRTGAAEDFARAQWRALFGSHADAVFQPGAIQTRWAADPWSRGSYAYARPGCAGARAVLAQPLAEGRLLFAGEATRSDGLAGTVGGAWLSGVKAAETVARALQGLGSPA